MDMHKFMVHVFWVTSAYLTPMFFLKVGTRGDFAGNFPPFRVIIYRERYAFWRGGAIDRHDERRDLLNGIYV